MRLAFASLLFPALMQVVERLRPSYRLIISVTVAARTPLWTQGTDEHENITGSSKLHLPRVSRTSDGAENMVAVDVGNGGAEAEVAASLSLGKSEIKAALERCAEFIHHTYCLVYRITRKTNLYA